MSLTWLPEAELDLRPLGPAGYARAALRGLPIVALLVGGLAVMLLLRPLEAAVWGRRRPATPWITVWACRGTLRLLGLRQEMSGRLAGAALVANHSSWLDIFVLNALGPVVFVAKAEVRAWGFIGVLARATGTLFVRREARGEAGRQVAAIAARIADGQRLALFPEGTSTDNQRVLPFKPALFEGLRAAGAGAVQPVTLGYRAPDGEDERFYGWFGGAAFGPHALAVLACRRQGSVRVTLHEPVAVAGRDRKAVAADCERLVRGALSPSPTPAP